MGTGRTVPASASQPAPVLEVVGNAVAHAILSRGAAAVLASDGSAILPPLVALVAAHKASKQTRSEHQFAGAVLVVVQTASAVVVGRQGEHVGADA
jgi:hypothetical protein